MFAEKDISILKTNLLFPEMAQCNFAVYVTSTEYIFSSQLSHGNRAVYINGDCSRKGSVSVVVVSGWEIGTTSICGGFFYDICYHDYQTSSAELYDWP
ncbi:hypothetical protein TNIN_159891 [Trichonephila inaurata madagascariensis]|uniref:Uncharacterized protein n=1 Tax=Trichonephila inaurata madagascariensis TaxID=2747483 RepID=A0A8X6XN27_9ARAC|nr:hypothetical protein TNIN_159891 [Trichonephila inaurata madagascariensis]